MCDINMESRRRKEREAVDLASELCQCPRAVLSVCLVGVGGKGVFWWNRRVRWEGLFV